MPPPRRPKPPSGDASGKPRPESTEKTPRGSSDVVGTGELRSSADRRDGLLSGITSFRVKRVRYSNVKGLGIFEGDISLGPVEKLDKAKVAADAAGIAPNLPASGRSNAPSNVQYAAVIVGQRYRWPGALVPYEVQAEIAETVGAAIEHWESKTGIRFVERTPATAASHPNYVSFEVRDGCWSAVGMQGGQQVVSIGTGCGIGQAIHEIGHALGLWHEQSREDRDQFVHISWENITPSMEHNFDQHITDGDDVGPYDYASIMHYPATAFSANGLNTITPVGGQEIGQRTGLSDGDVAAILELYPRALGARHIYTTSIIELANAIKAQGYKSDGVNFYGFAAPMPGAVPLLRLSHSQGSQLYSTSPTEAYDAMSTKGYTFDGVSCYVFSAPAFGLTPLLRLVNDAQRDYLYTTSLLEANQAIGQYGYTAQGVAGHVLSSYVPGTVPLYRLSKA